MLRWDSMSVPETGSFARGRKSGTGIGGEPSSRCISCPLDVIRPRIGVHRKALNHIGVNGALRSDPPSFSKCQNGCFSFLFFFSVRYAGEKDATNRIIPGQMQ